MNERVERLRAQLEADGMDAVVVTSLPNMRYLSGFTSADATLLITKRSCCLFTDFRYTIQAASQCPDFEVLEPESGRLMACLRDVLVHDDCHRCAFEQETMTVQQYERLCALPVALEAWSEPLSNLRLRKSDLEIASLQKAQQLADQSFAELLSRIGAGMTEREVVAELNYIGARLGSEGPSFDPIVASGPNGAMCHAVPSQRRLKEGDLVVLDFGCTVDGYHSDMTRTFAVGSVSDA